MADNKLINPNWAKHGYIQVYTGDGKGKTTASLGLAMRALGRSWKVLIIMFTKGGDDYGELNSFRNLAPKISENLTIVQAGLDRIVYSDNKSEADSKAIKKGWEIAKKANKTKIESSDLLWAITTETSSTAMQVLEQLGTDILEIREGIKKHLKN
jgi:ATP:corrinoid adenosyltransferase